MGKRMTLILGGARQPARAVMPSSSPWNAACRLCSWPQPRRATQRWRAASPPTGPPPGDWETLEAPLQVGQAILGRKPSGLVLVDCLTLLANNVLSSLPEPASQERYQEAMEREIEALLAAYHQTGAEWLVISNEVGLGLVPPYPSGRMYRDILGQANQRVAQVADEVVFLVAGLPMRLKG